MLHARVRENADNEADKIMWGSPGTMIWSGDLGVALYLAGCVDARAGYPVLDT